jgi:hypothetical protein
MEIRFKKCGISSQPDVCIFDDPCFSKFGALRGSCPHPGRQFVGHAPVGLSKRGRDTKSDADIQPEEMLTFFSNECPSAFPHEIPKCVSNNITYQRKARYAYRGNFLLLIVQHLDQKEPCKPVVCHYRHQIIDRRDERSGCNGRINMNFVEKHRDQRSHQA